MARTVEELLEDLGAQFAEFSLKVRQGEPVCSVIVSADGCVVVKTCRFAEDLADLVCEATDELSDEAEDRRARIAEAVAVVEEQLEEPEDEEAEDGWDPDGPGGELVAALEAQIEAQRRLIEAYRNREGR